MRTQLRIGRVFGVPIGLNWGVPVVCVLLTISLAQVSLPIAASDHPSSAYWFGAVVGVLGFLVSLAMHEMGHSYVAARNDMKAIEITLTLFGGVTRFDGEEDDARVAFRIAAAGPAMSFVTALVFGGGFWLSERWEGSDVYSTLLVWLCAINVVLAVSNLLPALPLDGGQMLRAVLWRRSGNKLSATRAASLIGQILAVALIVAALAAMRWWSIWSGMWILVFGLFFLLFARSEWTRSKPRPELMQCHVSELGRELPTPLSRLATVAELERVLQRHPTAPLVPVYDEHGQVSSWVTAEAIMRVPPAQRSVVPISSLVEPLWSLPRVRPTDSVGEVLDRLGSGRYWRAVVTDGSSLSSVLCSEDVEHVVELATA